jgi:hypothetical protein
MDIRPVRKDKIIGQAARCSYKDRTIYDREATIKLVNLFLQHPLVKLIYFNDDDLRKTCGPRVKRWPGHDDHLHIGLWEGR